MGVDGGGCNAVQHLIDSALRGVGFICVNTDVQALNRSTALCKIQIGERLTKGLSAGGNPSIGSNAALISIPAIKKCFADTDIVIVTTGMGGGTGTGASPIIAQAARELGALTVGVVTKPFSFEGAMRKAAAESGIAELRRHVDCLIVIPNDRVLACMEPKAPFLEMLRQANDILHYAVHVISAEHRRIQECGQQPGASMFGHILKKIAKSFPDILDSKSDLQICARKKGVCMRLKDWWYRFHNDSCLHKESPR